MQARFRTSIASARGWFYPTGAIVKLGTEYGDEEVPEQVGLAWLDSGLLEPVRASAEVAVSGSHHQDTAALKVSSRRTKRSRKNG